MIVGIFKGEVEAVWIFEVFLRMTVPVDMQVLLPVFMRLLCDNVFGRTTENRFKLRVSLFFGDRALRVRKEELLC